MAANDGSVGGRLKRKFFSPFAVLFYLIIPFSYSLPSFSPVHPLDCESTELLNGLASHSPSLDNIGSKAGEVEEGQSMKEMGMIVELGERKWEGWDLWSCLGDWVGG